jgi:hypothetical protein
MSEAADLLAQFRLLLDRYLPVVMAAALTCLGGDQQLEEDAAQLVLRGLAEKAPTLAKDIPHCTLGFIVMPFTRRRDWHEVNGEGPNERQIMLPLPWTKQMLMQMDFRTFYQDCC